MRPSGHDLDTTKASDGTHVVLVCANDLAGNQERTAQVTVMVANQPPDVGITPLWMVAGRATVTIHAGSSPVVVAMITVHDPQDRWPDLVVEYTSTDLPRTFTWTGRMGDGSIAYAGRYEVTVRIWDAYGNFDQATGWVIILLAPTATLTAEPTATATATPTPAATFGSTPAATIVSTGTAVPTSKPAPTITAAPAPAAPVPLNGWPARVVGTLGVFFLTVSLLDPRPRAWRHLARAKF